MKINRKEVLRYMGWRKGEPDEAIISVSERICNEFESRVTPKYTARKVDVSSEEDSVRVDGVVFFSKVLARHLKNVKSAIIISATLGTTADNIIRKEAVLGTLNASVAQSVGAAMIEDFLDEVTEDLKKKYSASFLPRFSPGYGDWDLKSQKIMLDLTDAKRCGITLTDSFMMVPTKSVTAIIGIIEN